MEKRKMSRYAIALIVLGAVLTVIGLKMTGLHSIEFDSTGFHVREAVNFDD